MYSKTKYTKVPVDVADDSESTPQFLRATRERSRRTFLVYSAVVFALVASNAITWFCTVNSGRTAQVGPRSTYGAYRWLSDSLSTHAES